jgi:EAL domain-containing protein (putative c-di-GMP-specific phosphodiesterase class I)
VPIAVNVSAIQIEKGGFLPLVRRVLADTGVDASFLALEVTESALLKERSRQIDELRELRSMGVRIEMDDFGTGYSSLSYLRELPIDTLKIDRSFIRKIDQDPVDQSIVRAILSMAASLGLRVVAEGVETAEQLDVLRREGCGLAQGFYFCRPIPPLQCRALLRELGRRPSFTETLRLECVGAQGLLAPQTKLR